MIETHPTSVIACSERAVRRQIDRSIARALVDRDYARLLLSDPTVILEQGGYAPQHQKTLRAIHANTLLDFAREAQAMFWAVEPVLTSMPQEDERQLAAAR